MNICGECSHEISFCSDLECCEKCGKPIVGFADKKLCYFCLNEKSKGFDRLISVFVYETLVRDALIKFKTSGLWGHTRIFSDCIVSRIVEEYKDIEFDFICGVPPHKNAKFDRIRLLSSQVSKAIFVPYKKGIFKFVKKVKKQSELGYKERKENVRNSLKVKTKIEPGQTVLVIDDVCTTRATLMECARALKEAGAKKVYAVTVATVKNPD